MQSTIRRATRATVITATTLGMPKPSAHATTGRKMAPTTQARITGTNICCVTKAA